MPEEDIPAILAAVRAKQHFFEPFLEAVVATFRKSPVLNGSPPILHSIRHRLKDQEHLADKLRRKMREGVDVSAANVFDRITDIAGVRILHLYQQDFVAVREVIEGQRERGDWAYFEQPKAYTWDPESRTFFEAQGLAVEVKESFYTSIHYVVKPRLDSEVSCEIQVRTLFEEIWGEIDHELNYPHPTDNIALREQIQVLARLIGAGSRLGDAIHRVRRLGA